MHSCFKKKKKTQVPTFQINPKNKGLWGCVDCNPGIWRNSFCIVPKWFAVARWSLEARPRLPQIPQVLLINAVCLNPFWIYIQETQTFSVKQIKQHTHFAEIGHIADLLKRILAVLEKEKLQKIIWGWWSCSIHSYDLFGTDHNCLAVVHSASQHPVRFDRKSTTKQLLWTCREPFVWLSHRVFTTHSQSGWNSKMQVQWLVLCLLILLFVTVIVEPAASLSIALCW